MASIPDGVMRKRLRPHSAPAMGCAVSGAQSHKASASGELWGKARSAFLLLRSKKAPSGAPTGFQLPHPCFLPDALYTAQPPARSNDERGAYFWIGVSNMHYLLLS